ncbi:MAG: hypothetical protein H6747_04440 [Deltaproteobacteria bacterium]|nr:hypothetical protein [Deltaproteobacteria bacterium]
MTPRSTSPITAAVGLLAVAGLLATSGCTGANAYAPRTVTVVDAQHAPDPRMVFGSLSLRMPLQQLKSMALGEGWQVQGMFADETTLTLVPPLDDPATQYGVVVEAGHVVQLAVDFRQNDERRVDARHQYAKSEIGADGAWAMTDAQRRTLVVVSPHGKRIVAVHLATLRDQQGAAALLERYLKE